jgi:hypothetical protein
VVVKVVVVVGKARKGGVSRKSLELNLEASADQDFQIQKACNTHKSEAHPFIPVFLEADLWDI